MSQQLLFEASAKTSTYEAMRAAIEYVLANYTRQPSLEAMAAAVSMETTAFQKTFTHWVGISPKRFVQAATRAHALRCLAAGNASLDVQLATGLSSPSRLHDLMVATDGMSPAQIRLLGADTPISWGVCDTPLGATLLGWTGKALTKLEFGERDELVATGAQRVAADWPAATLTRNDAIVSAIAADIFNQKTTKNPTQYTPLHLRGTGFQIQVWQALLRIPTGQLVSYGAIANALGRSGASRAVGTAVGSNPISVLIPCHRVIQTSGLLGGYAWGLERKLILLGQELG